MTEQQNLTALADLSGHWIDRVQPQRARTASREEVSADARKGRLAFALVGWM